MEEDTKIPLELNSGTYDVSTASGAFSPDEVDICCIKFTIEAVRHGSYVVFSTRLNPSNMEFVEKLERKCSDPENEIVWKLQSRLRVEKYEITPCDDEKSLNSDGIPGLILCCQKTACGKMSLFKKITIFIPF